MAYQTEQGLNDSDVYFANQHQQSYYMSSDFKDPNRNIKIGIWAYFFLLLFEGALRKWFLPGLATPLLIIRDPVALYVIFMVWKKEQLPNSPYFFGIILIGILATYTAMLFGHGSFPVAMYGARIFLLHIPFIFVMGTVFTREDVVKMGKVALLISIPMAVLIALQFYSPQSAWVNRGVGGDLAGAGFQGGLGYFRPPATFSFTNGTTLFFSLSASFIFYFWLNLKEISLLILIGATAALLAAIPLSISRALLFQVGLSMIFTLLATLRKPENLGRLIMAGIGGVVALIVLSQAEFFQTATGAFTDRFTSANETEGGLEGVFLDRFFGGLIGALTESSELPFFGYGIGMGTNVGSMLLSGDRQFLIAEEEWARMIGELGPLMGLIVVFIRVGISTKMAIGCYRKLAIGDLLPWLLLSSGLLLVAQGGLAQPTSLGFVTITGGLLIASLKISPPQAEQDFKD